MPRRPENRTCIIKGCGKYKVVGDYCKQHAKEFSAPPERVAVLVPTPKFEPLPVMSDYEVHCVNLVDLFKQKQQAQLEEFCKNITEIADPLKRLQYAAEWVL